MKYLIIFNLSLLFLIGCNKGDDKGVVNSGPQTFSESGQYNSDPTVKTKEREIKPAPPAGELRDWTYVTWKLKTKTSEVLTVESLAWCEVVNFSNKQLLDPLLTYVETEETGEQRELRIWGELLRGYGCLYHEELKISQGSRTTYSSVWETSKKPDRLPKLNFSFKPEEKNKFWKGNSDRWLALEKERGQALKINLESEVDFASYKKLLRLEFEAFTGRCKTASNWKELSKRTPEKQGNPAVYINFSTALDFLINTRTFYEIDYQTLSLQMIAIDDYWQKMPQPLEVKQDLVPKEYIPAQMWDGRNRVDWWQAVDESVINIKRNQFINVRDDFELYSFAALCADKYQIIFGIDVVPQDYPTECETGWQAFWPSFTKSKDKVASQLVDTQLGPDIDTPFLSLPAMRHWYRHVSRSMGPNTRTEKIMKQNFNDVPKQCIDRIIKH
ncbi:MAG: hypothetical protein B7Y39_02145 [Bdellovibrio sp. 28-41-41]|nr:MAG: hypothetical protein B7Y39_02145 [Bdellovibrio sp. 28-41-41]